MYDSANNERVIPAASPLTADDMHDSPEEILSCDVLPLVACAEITADYGKADAAALLSRSRHGQYTWIATTFGAVAVLAAIGELSLKNWPEHSSLEVVLATIEGVSLFVLMLLVLTEQKYKWLAPRHRAERCRLLKFKLLITPSRWHDGQWLRDELDRIGKFQDKESLEPEAKGPAPEEPSAVARQPLLGRPLRQLVEYYLIKRLYPQMEYFKARIESDESENRWLHRLAPDLFFLSVIGAVAHLLFRALSHWQPPSRSWSIYAALAAACLPAMAAAVRTLRSAFEYSRNKSRFEMAYSALSSVEVALTDSRNRLASDSVAVDSAAVLQEMWWCEHILLIEHYEWLRLMVETEWYG